MNKKNVLRNVVRILIFVLIFTFPACDRSSADARSEAYDEPADFYVSNLEEWNAARAAIIAASSRTDRTYHIIEVTSSFMVPGSTENTFGPFTLVFVLIRGDHALILSGGTSMGMSVPPSGNLLRIGAGQNVAIYDLKLVGHSAHNSPLVRVSGEFAFFNMFGNSMISGNSSGRLGTQSRHGSDDGRGGGVHVGPRGNFSMGDSATISGNSASRGAGVYVNGGIFTMSGGIISGNIARDNVSRGDWDGGVYFFTGGGGGVHINNGVFAMRGGIISGNSGEEGGGVHISNSSFRIYDGTIYGNGSETAVSENFRNTARGGGAALWATGHNNAGADIFAQLFGSAGWVPTGNFTTNNTINVVNSELVPLP
ncbi:MAG: hypothetical protein FWD87_10160 [Spirochaetaceae bacterium]|nr:hypothetical protein [Spirochaetaceae bacterium]